MSKKDTGKSFSEVVQETTKEAAGEIPLSKEAEENIQKTLTEIEKRHRARKAKIEREALETLEQIDLEDAKEKAYDEAMKGI